MAGLAEEGGVMKKIRFAGFAVLAALAAVVAVMGVAAIGVLHLTPYWP